MSNENIMETYTASEKLKVKTLRKLEKKLDKPPRMHPSKQLRLLSSSVESLMSSLSNIEEDQVTDRSSVTRSLIASQASLRSQVDVEKEKELLAKSPIRKILRANHRSYGRQRQMNDLLVKILERYELDKPILIHDKIDIIWNDERMPQDNSAQPKPKLTADEEFQRVLAELRAGDDMTSEKDDSQAASRARKADLKKWMKAGKANINHSAIKRKLNKRKLLRAQINTNQVKVYRKLLDFIEGRKAPNAWKKEGAQQAYQRPLEVEREFLDAFALIVESGYYIEQEDFLELIKLLKVHHQTELTGERIKIFEFFTRAAELLDFDVEMVKDLLQ